MEKENQNNSYKKYLTRDLIQFIKEHVSKNTFIYAIIGILLTIAIIYTFKMSGIKLSEYDVKFEKASLIATLKDRIIVLFLILLAGFVPYFYIQAIAYIAYILMLAGDVTYSAETNGTFYAILVNILPCLIDIFTVSIIVAIAIYMCKYMTKKYRYTQRITFSFLDIKIQFYEMTKNEDKYNKAVEKKLKKEEKMKQNDVNIDYINILKIAPVIALLNLIVCTIQYYIN